MHRRSALMGCHKYKLKFEIVNIVKNVIKSIGIESPDETSSIVGDEHNRP